MNPRTHKGSAVRDRRAELTAIESIERRGDENRRARRDLRDEEAAGSNPATPTSSPR
jgi:hypothetical protein